MLVFHEKTKHCQTSKVNWEKGKIHFFAKKGNYNWTKQNLIKVTKNIIRLIADVAI